MSEKHNDKILHEKYALVTKLHTTNKAWAHFGLKGNKDGLPDPVEIEKSTVAFKQLLLLMTYMDTQTLRYIQYTTKIWNVLELRTCLSYNTGRSTLSDTYALTLGRTLYVTLLAL